jgi:hypothetical protein
MYFNPLIKSIKRKKFFIFGENIKMHFNVNKRKENITNALICIIIFLFTFHKQPVDFSPGLDSSFMWALNHLFIYNYSALIKLFYTIGPLGFLAYPLAMGNNLIIALFFYSIVQLTFIYFLFKLNLQTEPENKAFALLLTFVISYFVNINFSIVGICVVALLLYHGSGKIVYFILACCFATVGLLIKSSIGITAFSVVFVFIGIHFYTSRKVSKLVLLTALVLGIFILSGLIVFKSFGLLITYSINIFRFGSGYSSALALFPNNNWYLLGGFILSILIFPLVVKDKGARLAYWLMLFPLFALWKYGMGREDAPHNAGLLYFLFVFYGIIVANSSSKKIILFFLPAFSILFYYSHMVISLGFTVRSLEITGINYFYESVIDYKEFFLKNNNISLDAIKKSAINERTRNKIGESTIDIYPFELSIVPANKLNWVPRKTLQSGAFAHWFDSAAASSFITEKAPEYIYFHLSIDKYGGTLVSLDERYLFNDEPLTINSILNNYDIVEKNKDFLLFKKKNSKNLIDKKILKTETTVWNKWIEVPASKNSLLSVSLLSKKTLIGFLKQLLYKDEKFTVEYELENKKIVTYRFNLANAQDGLWINPFIQHPENDEIEPKVTRIRLKCSNYSCLKDSIKLIWEATSIKDINESKNSDKSFILFHKNTPPSNEYIIKSTNDFEKQIKNWSSGPTDSTKAFSGKHSGIISAGSYSISFSLSLDSLWKITKSNEVTISTDVRCLVAKKAKAVLIFATENSEENIWVGNEIKNESDIEEWAYGTVYKSLKKEKNSTGRLYIYVWNQDINPMDIDDFNITIKSVSSKN